MPDPLDEIRALTRFDDTPVPGAPGKRGAGFPAGSSSRRAEARRSRLRGLLPLLVILGVICLLWSTPLVYPLRLLVVFFHELSHALMALATGGSVLHIELSPLEGGLAYTAGGSRFLTLSAGYLGSLVWGGAILWAATRLRGGRIVTGALAGLLLLVCLLWVRPIFSFGVLFCLVVAAGLLFVAVRLHHDYNDLLLKLIGLTSLLYAPLDILDDVLLRGGHPSDARMLAEMTFIPTLVWGVLWGAVSLVLAWWFLREAARHC